MESFANLMTGPVGVLIFAPFFWYGAWHRAKQTHLETEKIRSILEQITGKTGAVQTDTEAGPYNAG